MAKLKKKISLPLWIFRRIWSPTRRCEEQIPKDLPKKQTERIWLDESLQNLVISLHPFFFTNKWVEERVFLANKVSHQLKALSFVVFWWIEEQIETIWGVKGAAWSSDNFLEGLVFILSEEPTPEMQQHAKIPKILFIYFFAYLILFSDKIQLIPSISKIFV